ncbi:hypothetical protein A2914_01015 [Candidatus Nomurabacteria bacterium RIFCSPLOWO2_01_FULL_41_21]|uniref:HTH arsR-type domain-containing protein n=2 Tax=Candidatus Nomuraibacteriota TaxID=1752729 RepID=A0A1F6V229_9BACT|nr:MAG: hypothetical protein A2733_02105 [Candidatus Nomurabacteria bacterium RIFCSPHIGHO2_01_FULL_40_20]OGI87895.1 MAG: hypothetical protein A2914_01015 [Candidatus Nomurabacteria bacterium RIFCSPLOWO2_01_FULL_41_21]
MQEKDLEKIFKAFANRRRLAILKFLKKNKEQSVGEVADAIKLSFKSTSKHLLILSNAEIIEADQVSLVKFYSLFSKPNSLVKEIIDSL